MRELVQPCGATLKRDVELRIIVAPLDGRSGRINHKPATTYEAVLKFANEDFDTAEGLARVFDATSAACAFPGLFAPVHLKGLGPCVDGGAVNNAPIGYALKESGVNQVMMAIPFPAVMPAAKSLDGTGLLTHLVEILINERLYRDLRDAHISNDQLSRVEKMVAAGSLTVDQARAVEVALDIRKIDLIEVRPSQRLAQGAFSGFFRESERELLVEEGRKAARLALASTSPSPEIGPGR